MVPGFIDRSALPHRPGIYLYKDSAGEILYVGKAVDLHHRVASYFNRNAQTAKIAQLVERIRFVETIVVATELEALILEANLIKKYLPPYNIALKDDRDYIYIGLTDERFPRVVIARKKDEPYLKRMFGPFPSATTVKKTLRQLRKVFPWCSNPPGPRNKTYRPCFYLHLGLCPGACVGKISGEDYNQTVRLFVRFMEGKQRQLLSPLRSEMERLSAETKFEEAARLKRMIEGIDYLLQPTSVSQYLENPNFLEDQNRQALKELQIALNLSEVPIRIECYDISNLQGIDATGSMVVLTVGEVDKSQYRKFKIKISGRPDDFAMHQEVMGRRLRHKEWPLPQLFLIDGGRGQVRAAKTELDGAGVDIPIFGLAKRREWLYPPEGEPVRLPGNNLGLRIVQKIRDESHRFAITYHRKLRAKSFLPQGKI